MSDTGIPKQYEYDSFDGYVDALEEFARVANKERNDALQLARELRGVIELIQNSSFSAPESKEEAETAERAQAIIDAALTKANQLLK